ncbi:MAG TPA: YfiR family protein [Thermoanaerobaculia bacterium]|nr:YfiR family protein [Thermoanaerobaculia bacterium]
MAVLRKAILAALLLAGPVTPAAAQTPEYDLKAAFLYNFVKFVEWPEDAFDGERAPVAICVFGEDPFGRTLDAVIQGERVGERRLVVQRPDSLDDLKDCHVLFVSRSERERMREVLDEVEGRPVLTVSDTDGFLRAGGVINFVPEGSKVRFRINPEAAERGGLRISSKLLRLAMTPGGR